MRSPGAGRQPTFELENHSNGASRPSNALEDLEGFAEIVARRTAAIVLEALDQRAGEAPNLDEFVDAKTLADLLGVSRDHVYRHADELGAIRTGGALRFNLETATRRSMSKRSQVVEAPANTANRARPRGARSGTGARRVPASPLLPIGSVTDRRRREEGR
jgi:hypothetical protein